MELTESAVPPAGLPELRRACMIADGADPFQHAPDFAADPASGAEFSSIEGDAGLRGAGILWGPIGDRYACICVVPGERLRGLGGTIAEWVRRVTVGEGADVIRSWVAGAGFVTDRFCDRWQGVVARRLMKLTVELPAGEAHLPEGYEVRGFRPGDVPALVAVNSEAFADHPDQATMTAEDVEAKISQPWFDPDGLLLAWKDGEPAAYCWTKVHSGTDPPEGEIHLIGTAPVHQGRGLGRAMTLAGLRRLENSTRKGTLYVDEMNVAARSMYRRIGFRIERVDVQYRFQVPS